jgi:hypothetical protein
MSDLGCAFAGTLAGRGAGAPTVAGDDPDSTAGASPLAAVVSSSAARGTLGSILGLATSSGSIPGALAAGRATGGTTGAGEAAFSAGGETLGGAEPIPVSILMIEKITIPAMAPMVR